VFYVDASHPVLPPCILQAEISIWSICRYSLKKFDENFDKIIAVNVILNNLHSVIDKLAVVLVEVVWHACDEVWRIRWQR